jgi:hypothetical protein
MKEEQSIEDLFQGTNYISLQATKLGGNMADELLLRQM